MSPSLSMSTLAAKRFYWSRPASASLGSFSESRFLALLLTGVDATEAFEEIGHSEDARSLLVDMYMGEIEKVPQVSSPSIHPKISFN